MAMVRMPPDRCKQNNDNGRVLGFPGDFDTSTFMTVAVPYLKTISWDGILKPRLQAAISILKMHNAKKIAAVGFCWSDVCPTM